MLLTKLREGEFSFKQKMFDLRLKIQRISKGWKISGKVKGKPERLDLLALPVANKFLLNNWQSWGPCRVIFKDQFVPLQIDENWKYSASLFPELLKKKFVSDYFLASDQNVCGFLSSLKGHGFFTIEDGQVIAYLEYFNRVFEDFVELEPLVILEGADTSALLEEYGDMVKIHNNITIKDFNGTGWCSWYHYFLDLSWEEILKNATVAKQFGINVFQIDDGYEKDIGDWLQTREGFPPLEEMAKTLKHMGFTVGIWLAPFSVSETSHLFMEHPEWVVSENKEPKVAYKNWNKKIYALDLTKNEVKQWFYEMFFKLRQIGFEYFKIDFLFAGAVPGQRENALTPVEAFRDGLRTIRKAIGDAFLLGCGSPLLAAVGFVDAMRIGPDTTPYWGDDIPDLAIPAAKWALRNAITRYFMHKRFWINDPDCLLLRSQKTDLTLQERQLYAFTCGVLDNMIVLSDDLALVDETAKEILQKTLSLSGGNPKVIDILNEQLRYTVISRKKAGDIKLHVDLINKYFSLGGFC